MALKSNVVSGISSSMVYWSIKSISISFLMIFFEHLVIVWFNIDLICLQYLFEVLTMLCIPSSWSMESIVFRVVWKSGEFLYFLKQSAYSSLISSVIMFGMYHVFLLLSWITNDSVDISVKIAR
eukprot:NODE_525_length_6489_cov_0.356338.p6 type:complete len:124 gc:universal NODE_525_length_6489_cov_0.356338:5873-6244(+)